MDSLSRLLENARYKKGLTQRELAAKLKLKSVGSYYFIESGVLSGVDPGYSRVPHKEHLKKLAQVLGLEYKQLADAAIERTVVNKKRYYDI